MPKPIAGLVTALLLVASVGCSQSAAQQQPPQPLKLTVDAGGVARRNTPVVAMLTNVDNPPPSGPARLTSDTADSAFVPAQVGNLGGGRISVRWIEPSMNAGEKKNYTLTMQPGVAGNAFFRFKEGDGVRDLYHGERPVMTQVIKFDPNDHFNTYKPFDHVYSFRPATQPSTQPHENRPGGYRPITKGPGGQFPHHRGIYFGFNKTAYGDFWHCNKGESQRHESFDTAREWAGPVAAKMASVTNWVAADGKPKFRDAREVTAWRVSEDELVLDYDITLETVTGQAEKLAGDAHHAGFHFRGANELANAGDRRRRGGAVHYVFPESAKLIKDDVWGELAWTNANFELFGRRYSVTHMDAPANPDPTTYSTRPYGRFGAFFTAEVTPEKPMKVSYRLVIRDITGGATTQPAKADVEAEYHSFAKPVTVELAK
jgi:hypothetical protein